MTCRAMSFVLFKVALLLATPALAQPFEHQDDMEPVRDVPKVEPPDPITETEAQFGLLTRSDRRWRRERPTEHNVDAFDEVGLIETLTNDLWADRGFRDRKNRGGIHMIDSSIERAMHQYRKGDYDSALRRLKYAATWAAIATDSSTRHLHGLMASLASDYVRMGDLGGATRAYKEMLLLGRYLPPEHTAAALNKLIATHFDLGDYETALMYVRVGIAVLDDVGIGPYRAMNRIIAQMSNPETAVDALEQDFDTALARLESAVASAMGHGLIVEDQWWAPVYLARHDREEAIRILRTMLAPIRHEAGDILRETAVLEESVQ